MTPNSVPGCNNVPSATLCSVTYPVPEGFKLSCNVFAKFITSRSAHPCIFGIVGLSPTKKTRSPFNVCSVAFGTCCCTFPSPNTIGRSFALSIAFPASAIVLPVTSGTVVCCSFRCFFGSFTSFGLIFKYSKLFFVTYLKISAKGCAPFSSSFNFGCFTAT
ncbi:hypothetical protein BTAR23_AR23_04076 [Bacillus thuringiensis serovar israelensis]|uniref:Uncharacterized protein n=1 Tax=Bacillus thuringiensis subsp. israelensis TaxID=1430 RepID=A0AAX3HTC8_BACTI|nr:hypothetical protein BTAR23_AR23_04076 [Bacillus thuringiensis serovar israelensis]